MAWDSKGSELVFTVLDPPFKSLMKLADFFPEKINLNVFSVSCSHTDASCDQQQ